MPWPKRQRSGTTETEIVARNGRKRTLATIRISLTALQGEAEGKAGESGDPVGLMVDAIASRLAAEGADVIGDDRARLESALSTALLDGEWPTVLEVRATVGDGDGPPAATLPPELFEKHLHYPSDDARRVYERLVGLEPVKARLVKEAIVLTQPSRLQRWAVQHHGRASLRALEVVRHGSPLLVFAGDVGTGKSALAESFGDAVARALGGPVSLLRMSIQTRGSGIVGDMTRQISRAFREAEAEARRTRRVTILLLDEADALAESRETRQMHHEDRAGVNALIQGIDHLRGSGVPALVVFCSNRLASIDPAILRRAVDTIEFRRPDAAQRRQHLEQMMGDLGLTEAQWRTLVDLTGPREGRRYGFTYSDLADRLLRNAVLAAFPDDPLSFALLERLAREMSPTPPFGGFED